MCVPHKNGNGEVSWGKGHAEMDCSRSPTHSISTTSDLEGTYLPVVFWSRFFLIAAVKVEEGFLVLRDHSLLSYINLCLSPPSSLPVHTPSTHFGLERGPAPTSGKFVQVSPVKVSDKLTVPGGSRLP